MVLFVRDGRNIFTTLGLLIGIVCWSSDVLQNNTDSKVFSLLKACIFPTIIF